MRNKCCLCPAFDWFGLTGQPQPGMSSHLRQLPVLYPVRSNVAATAAALKRASISILLLPARQQRALQTLGTQARQHVLFVFGFRCRAFNYYREPIGWVVEAFLYLCQMVMVFFVAVSGLRIRIRDPPN